jgi:hypothetical protein
LEENEKKKIKIIAKANCPKKLKTNLLFVMDYLIVRGEIFIQKGI